MLKWQLFVSKCLCWLLFECAFSQNGHENSTTCRVPFHDSMPSLMNFRRVLDLLEFKNQVSLCFAGNQRCPGVWNSFPIFAWDLSMHPRTQIWFFNLFICTGACACSSNLNYAHEMPRKPSYCIKMSKRTPKNSKSKHNTPVVLCWHEKKNLKQ